MTGVFGKNGGMDMFYKCLLGVLVGLIVTLPLVACLEDESGPDKVVTVTGTITDEGVECIAMRDSEDRLYTLAGDTGEYGPGDKVCVRGTIAEMSHCMQGTTIAVEWIGLDTECNE